MNEVLSREEMEQRFANEWVLIGDPETDSHLMVLRGTVLNHSKDRDEVYQTAIDPSIRHIAFLYLGEPPPGMAYVL